MKNLFGALCLMATSFVLAQDYVSGYYMNANGQKITGEYEVGDFSAPENLKFRTGDGEFMQPDLKNIQELGIGDSYKYVKYTVEVDAANTFSDSVIPEKPVFLKKEVFLNVLAEGDATLFSYYDNWDKDVKFFFKTPDTPVPQQLVHREYYKNGKPAENNDYIRQISAGLVCDGLKGADIVKLQYTQSSLTRFVKQYNTCKGTNTIVYDNRAGRRLNLLFSAYAGMHMFSFEMSGGGVPPMAKDSGVGVNFGGELELLFPSKQLGLFLRIEGESFNAEVEGTFAADNVPGSHKYYVYKTGSFIGNASLGPRYYFAVNQKNRLFVDVAASFSVGLGGLDVYDYVVSSTTVYPREFVDKYNFGNALSLNADIGYSFNNRFAVEFRASTNRDLIDRFPENSKMKYSRAGIGIKYTF